ncbi:unnamed protein product [Peronospora farinosa]|uniref:PX domain-containing protein n=1 Tax=Peronospora farinosa TaxID=134698 RepID=A0AAV0UY95_9STRA|nr:unnamed protein product [Peronospora farinosa]CAI5740595.1 unnamed protein product [Peronospora farinosa]
MSASTIMPRLQSLLPVTMKPTRRFKASEPLASLEKIDRVEINDTIVRGGVVFYVLDVYLKHCSSRIPTNKTTKAISGGQPDYHLERRFTDFANLRYQVWAYAQRKCQDGLACRYCKDFMNYIVHSMAQPRLFVKVTTGVETRKKLMTIFCNEFIGMTFGGNSEMQMRNFACDGFQAIPYVIECFFREKKA